MSQRGKFQFLKKVAVSLLTVAFCQAQDAPDPADLAPADTVSSAETSSPLRLAVVDVQELFREYYKTAEAQEKLNIQRTLVSKQLNERKENAAKYQQEFVIRLNKVKDPKTSVLDKVKLESELKQLSDALQKDALMTSQAYKSQVQDLDRQMELKMDGILAEIQTLAEIQAKKAGYDMVIDISGSSTNLVPMLVFARHSENITAALLKELNKDAAVQR